MSIINKCIFFTTVKMGICAILMFGCTPKDPSENDLRSPCMRQPSKQQHVVISPKPIACTVKKIAAHSDSCPTTNTKCNT